MNIETLHGIEKEQPLRILEVAAGNNSVLKRMVFDGVLSEEQVVVSDLSEERMRNDKLSRSDTGVSEVVAAVYELPFRTQSFSHVLISNMLGDPAFKVREEDHYVSVGWARPDAKYIEPIFKELSRVLRENGEVCVVETYTPEFADEFFRANAGIVGKYFEYRSESNLLSEVPATVGGSWVRGGKIFALKKKRFNPDLIV